MVGCGGGSSHKAENASADHLSAQAVDANSVAALVKFGASIKRNEQGEVVEVDLDNTEITDAGLVHLKEWASLTALNLGSEGNSEITDAGLVQLGGLTNLQGLDLSITPITDAGLMHLVELTNLQTLELIDCYEIAFEGMAELKEALPNCKIERN